MPSYELSLILRGALNRPELAQALKRSCEQILNKGSLIHKIENLGHRELPYYIRSHGTTHKEGKYFLVHFDSSIAAMEAMKQDLKRDANVVKNGVIRKDEAFQRPCLSGPCQFGEIPDPLHEKRIYRKKTLKVLNTMSKKSLSK